MEGGLTVRDHTVKVGNGAGSGGPLQCDLGLARQWELAVGAGSERGALTPPPGRPQCVAACFTPRLPHLRAALSCRSRAAALPARLRRLRQRARGRARNVLLGPVQPNAASWPVPVLHS